MLRMPRFFKKKVINFEKVIVLNGKQRFVDDTVVLPSKSIEIDFAYPFVGSGFDADPKKQIVKTFTQDNGFTRANLANLSSH